MPPFPANHLFYPLRTTPPTSVATFAPKHILKYILTVTFLLHESQSLFFVLYIPFFAFLFSHFFSVTNAFTVPFNDADVQFFVRLRTLCLCVLLADNQEIIRTLFTEELLMKGRFSPASVHAHDTCMHARQ